MSGPTETPQQAARRLAAGAIRDGYLPEALHVYVDRDGKPLHWRIRLKHPDTKDKWIRPMRLNGAGFELGEPEYPDGKPLYRLYDLTGRPHEPVIVVEGELCSDRLAPLDVLATTSGAADSAGKADWRPLAGRDVTIWPDNDEAGQRYAAEAAQRLPALGCTVRVIDVEALGLPAKGDAVDWLKANPAATAADIAALPCVEARRGDEWPEPQPLDRKTAQPDPFPLDKLPGGIGQAVREYQTYGQQPVALVASSALAVVSLAAQGLADVARDERLCGPLSLNFITIAKSGERKTAADKALGAALTKWESESVDALREDIKLNRAALDGWAAEQEGLKAAIKATVRKKPEEAEGLRKRLTAHALTKPTEIIAPRLRYEDVNPQSLAFMLATGHQSAALWSDEGGMVTGSHGMGKDSLLGYMAGLNRLWDGGSIHHDRKQAQSVHLEGRRLTVSLMVQPLVLRELAERSSGLTRGSGFLARYLVAAPMSTMGTRLYQEAPEGMALLAAFHTRIRELLDSPLPLDDQGRLRPPVLRLSPSAFERWRRYHDEIELELKPLGEYETVCDFAAKSAENAVRIAGCIHVFEKAQGAIAEDTMQRATALARWYLREALRALDVLDEPQPWSDARLLDAWLAASGDSPTRDVLRLGPGPLRDKTRRNAAIDVLSELGRARIERDGRRETLARNPALQRFATATPATFATDGGSMEGSVARVATVAVAERQNQEIERGEL